MVATVIILGIALAAALLIIIVLSAALMVAVEQINHESKTELDVPPIKWDYSVEDGWVDAEVENDE